MPKRKHLTDDDRLMIEHLLQEQTSIKGIARRLDKSPSTISREIKARSILSDKSARLRVPNRCIHRRSCKRIQLCLDKPDCTKRCSACKWCNFRCESFLEESCRRLLNPPYVCNGCHDEASCTLRKRYYLHKHAHDAYRRTLIEARTGANITEDELLALDEFISPLLRNGQSIHHIVANNPNWFSISEKSLYRYVGANLLHARNIDLPLRVKLKPRRSKPMEHKVDRLCREGRTIQDFDEFRSLFPFDEVQMDTVIGRIGGKTLLTLHLTSCDLMLALLLQRNASQFVIDAFAFLQSVLGFELFCAIFPAILTDNGSEFTNPLELEYDDTGNRRTFVFYCNPGAAYQKPKVERNHTLLRRILPKGSSFDDLSQEDINLVISHINSYSRSKHQDKTPFELFSFLYGPDILSRLGLQYIPANSIILKPILLKK